MRGDRYKAVYCPTHHKASASGMVNEHILVAEAAIGRELPETAEVHHVNGDRCDNRPENLVICEDHAFHGLLHQRAAAYAACGHAHYRKCVYCKVWCEPSTMAAHQRMYRHKACHAAAVKHSRKEKVRQ